MAMASAEHYGLLSKNVLPSPEKPLGAVTNTVRFVRNILTNWAEDIPVLNWGVDLARRLI